MRSEVILFDGFDELDVFGPFEVLADNFDTVLVTLEGERQVRSDRGVDVRATGVLSERPELVVVPGGGWLDGATEGVRAQVERGALPAAIAARHAAGTTVASVCTGAMALAHAGVLDGRRATTNPLALDDLRAFDVEVVEARYVDDGDVLTAGAPSCGIDLALHLVERALGADAAAAGATAIGYAPVAV